MDLATQVSAFVGTSLLLFIVTKPKKDSTDNKKEEDNYSLTGVWQYSSYHRKRLQVARSLSRSNSPIKV
jgi:hypothetical protein